MEIEKKDPVCGISVDPLKSPHQHTLGGTRFSFCSVGCKDKFAANVGAYLSDYGLAPSAEGGPIYVCPNLPGVDHTSPGDCPLCGSRLEPKNPITDLEEHEEPEPVDTPRRFWASLARRCWPWATCSPRWTTCGGAMHSAAAARQRRGTPVDDGGKPQYRANQSYAATWPIFCPAVGKLYWS